MPESFDEQYEYIIVDQCNESTFIILHSYRRFMNYIWIVLNVNSSEVGSERVHFATILFDTLKDVFS